MTFVRVPTVFFGSFPLLHEDAVKLDQGIKSYMLVLPFKRLKMKSLDEIKLQVQALKPVLKRRFKVETIEVFGSYSKGEQTEKSDLDLLITYSEPVDLLVIARLRRYLKRKLHMKVDVVSKEFLNKNIKEKVLQEAVAV